MPTFRVRAGNCRVCLVAFPRPYNPALPCAAALSHRQKRTFCPILALMPFFPPSEPVEQLMECELTLDVSWMDSHFWTFPSGEKRVPS